MPVRVWACSDVNASTASPRVADADDDADHQSIDVKPDEDHHSDDEQSDADEPRSSASRDTDVQSAQSVIVVSAGDDDANDHRSDVQPDDDKESDVEPDDADEPVSVRPVKQAFSLRRRTVPRWRSITVAK